MWSTSEVSNMKKCIVISDSFKGTLSSLEICSIARKSVPAFFPDCEVIALPVADGGEGTVDSFRLSVGGEVDTKTVTDPLGRKVQASYCVLPDGTAVVEMAQASGLILLNEEELDPLRATTYGTDELIRHALDRGCRRFIIGIGGSSTNDGGAGMAQALGSQPFCQYLMLSARFTATEFEKRTGLIFEAQDRMQKTLLRQTGIEDAVVNFTVPETSNYIWDQTNQQTSTAGVSVRMRQGYELTPERVSAIKHLAATAIPKLNADDVVVVDAATGVEMPGLDDPNATGYYSVQRLDYEQLIAKRIEDNVKRLLASRYGTDGVTAVATVVLDYDKMVSESKQYQNNGNGNTGVTNHFEERYSLGGTVAAGGIVGEANNTDYPPT